MGIWNWIQQTIISEDYLKVIMEFLTNPSTLHMLENMCLVVTFAMFSSGIPDAKQMLATRATGNVQFLPFLMCCINCSAWLIYGRLKDNQTIFFVNLVGAISQAFYMTIYIIFSTMQRPLMKLTVFSFMVFWFVHWATMSSFTVIEATNVFGTICCIITCLMFASPLTEINSNWKEVNSNTFLSSHDNLIFMW